MLSCIDLGALHYERKEYKKSHSFFEKSLSLALQIGAVQNVAVCYSNLGELSRIYKDFQQSIDYYRKGLEIAEAAGDYPLASSCYSGIGYGLVQLGNTAEGIRLLKKGFEMAIRYDDINNTVGVATYLHEALAKTGDYKNAYHYLKIAKAYTDTIERENDVLDIQQIGFDYELKKKEETIKQLMKEREYEEQRANLNRYLVYALLLMAVFAVGFIFTLYRSREKSRKHAIVTARQNEETRLQAERLQALNDLNNNMFSIISHDLRNPIATLSNVIQLEKEQVISEEESRNMKDVLSTQVHSINLLLDNLLLWARAQIEKNATVNTTDFDVATVIENNVRLLSETARQKNVQLEYQKPAELMAKADAIHTDIIIRNLLANAIKFSNPLGKVLISTDVNKGFATISIRDEGTEIATETLQKINAETLTTFSIKGTAGETGSGLGLKLCREYIQLNNGKFTISSELGKGTECIVSLPIA
jgi:signal transduction histidine kinase